MASKHLESGGHLRRQQARLRLLELEQERSQLLRAFPDLAFRRIRTSDPPTGVRSVRPRWRLFER